MVILFMPPNLDLKRPFSCKKIEMAREKGIGSLKTSGIEIYTMSSITG